MAIEFIDNQPIYFTGALPTDSECKSDCTDYCSIYDVGDPISFQFKNTPCDTTNLFCAPNLINYNEELVLNGNFDTSSNWTFGTGWVYDSANHRAGRSSSSTGNLSQTLGGIINGRTYIVRFTMTARGIGGSFPSCTVTFAGTSVGIPGRPFSGGGTYQHLVVAGSGSSIVFTSSSDLFSIDDVSIKEAIVGVDNTYCLYSSAPYYWQNLAQGGVTHLTGDSNALYTDFYPTNPNGYIKVKIKVTNMSSGTLDLICNTDLGVVYFGLVTQNGDYEFYTQYWSSGSPSFFQMQFQPTQDYDGTINNIEVYDLTFKSSIQLQSLTPGGPIYTLNDSNIQYDKEYVIVTYSNGSIQPGKYVFSIIDLCGTATNADMIYDYNFDDCDWSIDNGTSNCTGGIFSIDGDSGLQYVDVYPNHWEPTFTDSQTGSYLLQFETGQWPVTSIAVMIYDTANNVVLVPATSLVIGIQSYISYNVPFTITNPFYPNPITPVFRFFNWSVTSSPEKYELNSMRIVELISYPSQGTMSTSNCVDIKTHHPCTHWIKGTCDQKAYGFNFSNNFGIQGRIKSMFLNPKYKGDFNRYADANGNFTVTRASSNKIYEFLIDYCPERSHDWLRLALVCDTINIGLDQNTTSEWVNTQGEYQPEWPNNIGNFNLAQCRLELQKKTDELYNNNAG